jgi:large subunit ribosomal protein L15
MLTKRRSKRVRKMRGSSTHGWGRKSKHRGSGNRGGFGNAGTGKRAQSKKPSINPSEYFGKHGFHSVYERKYDVVNVGQIGQYYDSFKEFEKDGILDLDKMGYKKLLSSGKWDKKVSIKINFASSKAVEKVQKAGGKVILLNQKEAKEEKSE